MGPRILVVDDQEDVRLLLRAVLERQGWDVDEAVSGEDAVELCGSETVDLVVVDFKMPGISGMDVARQLRDQGFEKSIILYSAYLSREVTKEADSIGVPTVDKTDFSGLVGILRQIIEESTE